MFKLNNICPLCRIKCLTKNFILCKFCKEKEIEPETNIVFDDYFKPESPVSTDEFCDYVLL